MTAEKTMPKVYSVSELVVLVRSVLEGSFPMVDMEGEVSDFKPYPSGHVYFTLKDSSNQISAVMFKSAFAACDCRGQIANGVRLKVRGSVTVGPRSRCQIVVRRARLQGEGGLMRKFLELKAKLESEGLFDSARKRPLPFLPRRIGVVTSMAGAVVHDICRVLMRRFPALEIRLFPAKVQGADAPATLIAGIEYFNSPPDGWLADLMIVGRGGGSFEDLFCFNDEALVRAIAASRIPVVSAVGHETDFTLADFASDLRAGTPSMAAELVVPELTGLLHQLDELLSMAVSSLRGRYEHCAERVDMLGEMLSSELEFSWHRAEAKVEKLSSNLELLSPYAVLERGYSLTTDADGLVVFDAGSVKSGEKLHTRFASGSIDSVVV